MFDCINVTSGGNSCTFSNGMDSYILFWHGSFWFDKPAGTVYDGVLSHKAF
jgi:hypothetical protein